MTTPRDMNTHSDSRHAHTHGSVTLRPHPDRRVSELPTATWLLLLMLMRLDEPSQATGQGWLSVSRSRNRAC